MQRGEGDRAPPPKKKIWIGLPIGNCQKQDRTPDKAGYFEFAVMNMFSWKNHVCYVPFYLVVKVLERLKRKKILADVLVLDNFLYFSQFREGRQK